MTKYRSLLNPPPVKRTEVVGKSLTVPNQTMSIREMINRHQKGLPLSGYGTAIPHGENIHGIPFARLDLTEQHAILQDAENTINAINERKKKSEADKAELKRQEEIKAAAEQMIREMKPKTDEGGPQ